MRVARRGAALLLIACASGCSYPEVGFADDDVAPAEDAPADGSSTDAPPADTGRPPPVDTGPPPVDTGPPPPIDTGPPTFCSTGTPHVFCADFDAVKTHADGWDAADLSTGTLALDGLLSVSAPNSLLAKLTGTSSGALARLRVVRTAKTSKDSVRLELRARLEAWAGGPTGSSTNLSIARIMRTGADPSNSPWVSIGVGSSGISVRHAPNPTTTPTSELTGKAFPPGSWVSFRLDVRFSDSTLTPNTTISLTMDGAPVWSGTTIIGSVDPTFLDTELAVGVFRVGTGSPYAASFDNVTLDWF